MVLVVKELVTGARVVVTVTCEKIESAIFDFPGASKLTLAGLFYRTDDRLFQRLVNSHREYSGEIDTTIRNKTMM